MVHPQHALAVYAESLASGRRVAVLGDASLGLGERLDELGARIVEVWDPDEERVRTEAEHAPRGITVRVLPIGADVRPASFDLVLVPDLALFDDPRELLSLARRAVGDRGVALVAAANRDVAAAGTRAFDYYELFDLVAGEFEEVRMIAQLPFYGIALAELGQEDDAPTVSVDMQLADTGRAPQAFVAIASQASASLEPYAIIELPAPATLRDASGALEEAVSAVAQAQLRAEAFAGQLEEVRARLALVERASAVAVEAQEQQLQLREAQVAELESALARRAHQLAELSIEVEEVRSAADAGRVAAAQVEELAQRADRAERAAAALEPELARFAEAHSSELGRFEEALRERAQAVRHLEAEVARRERMVHELVDALDEGARHPPGGPAGAASIGDAASVPLAAESDPRSDDAPAVLDSLAEENVRLRANLDALALDLARREGESQASAWALDEMERRLGQMSAQLAPAAPGPSSPDSESANVERKLALALEELDVLRQAMAQEHAQRLRVESGEELVYAKAEIQKQASLLEQLGYKGGHDAKAPAPGPGASPDASAFRGPGK